jgi:Zn-dependent protease with chaperone function
MMRFFGPLVTLAAIASFVLTLIAAAIATLALPAIALALGIAALVSLHPFTAHAILKGVPEGIANAASTLRFALTAILHPLRPERVSVGELGRLPELMRFSGEVAAEMGVASLDGALLVPEANFGVIEVAAHPGIRRILVAGAPLLFILTVEELRAVIAHEVAHIALRHTSWGRALGRWEVSIEAMADAQGASWHPVSLSLRFSAFMMRRIRGPWSRSEELAADWLAAGTVGAGPMISALRHVRDAGPALEVLMLGIASRTHQTGVGPESWTEAAYRSFEEMPPSARQRLRRALSADPFDVDGRTHPPIPLRIASLSALPRAAQAGDARRAITILPDVLIEERALTRSSLKAHRWVPARSWSEEVEPKRVEARLASDVAASTGYAEIDFEGR